MHRTLAAFVLAGALLPPLSDGQPVSRPGEGISTPTVVAEVKPRYTPLAVKMGVQGAVTLECVVLPTGTCGDIKVTDSLDPSLDQEAIAALKKWRFKPGLKDGEPVAMSVTVEFTFTLRDRAAAPLFVPPRVLRTLPLVIYRIGDGVSAPKIKHEVKPSYTPEAMRAGIQGTITVECIVMPDGTVGHVRLIQPLDPSLDEQALDAVRRWTFTPGMKDGRPVPVRVTIDLTLTLRK